MEKVNEVSEGRYWMLVLSGQSRVQLAPGWGHTCLSSPAGMTLLLPRWDTEEIQRALRRQKWARAGSGGGRDRALEAEPLQLTGCECCRLALWV